MSELDKILHDLYYKSFDVSIINPDIYYKRALAAIQAWALGMVGSDEPKPTKTVRSLVDKRMTYAKGVVPSSIGARNQFRREIRDRIKGTNHGG